MKILASSLVVICMLVGLAAADSIPDSSLSWNEFKEKYNKAYGSFEEESRRQEIFAKNKQKIQEFNRLQSTKLGFALGVNHLSDLLHEEYLKAVVGQSNEANWLILNISDANILRLTSLQFPVPDSIDYRSSLPARVGPIKDQGLCAASWAFAVCGLLEAQEYRNSTASLATPLSEQNLIDCKTDRAHACSGGTTIELGLELVMREGGVMRELDYPYESAKGLDNFPCRYKQQDSFITSRIKGYQALPRGEEGTMKWAVALSGPIAVTIDASLDTFAHYKSGVYYDQRCKVNGSHSVLVVGYGQDRDFGDYWIIRNSWSEAWGMQGYMFLARNRPNHCGVANSPIMAEPMAKN